MLLSRRIGLLHTIESDLLGCNLSVPIQSLHGQSGIMLLEPESARVWIIWDIRQNEEAAEADTNSHDAVDNK